MTFQLIGIVGAGAMGRGIAQIAAQAGASVLLFDQDASALNSALSQVRTQSERLVVKGKLDPEAVASFDLRAASSLGDFQACDLVLEAVVEDLRVKQLLMTNLEAVVSTQCVIATNTSSLSVTSIGAAMQRPDRLAGCHFFNPVPLMRVAEVIQGVKTKHEVCQGLSRWVRSMGHTPVQAKDTPGFIVNHAGRGLGTEALRIVGEGVTDFATVDRILRDQVGFKLGPFELMDLTALDVSHPVMESIYRQYFDEPRYRPSPISAQRLAGGLLGKKTGQGFYAYENGQAVAPEDPKAPLVDAMPTVWVSAHAARRSELIELIRRLGAVVETGATASANALILVAPLGLDVTTAAVLERLDATRTMGIDLLLADQLTRRRVLASTPATGLAWRDAAHALFARDAKSVSVLLDSAGFVTQRVLGNIVNIACDMCQQRICTPDDLDLAVTLGLAYPSGPLALGDKVGGPNVLEVLMNMLVVYNDPRYRPSPWLRRRAALGLSLTHKEVS